MGYLAREDPVGREVGEVREPSYIFLFSLLHRVLLPILDRSITKKFAQLELFLEL